MKSFCDDNNQVGEELVNQLRKYSLAFLKGTHGVTHWVYIYDNTDWDEQCIPLTGLSNQPMSSSTGMAAY